MGDTGSTAKSLNILSPVAEDGGIQARRLPAGVHGIPRDVVERNQRERLIAAMAEECAERGYAETSVAEITRRASVSTASFYRQFKDRRECMLASFEELFARLAEAIEGACDAVEDGPDAMGAGLRTAVELLAGDTPTARLLTVEITAVGREGVRLQQEAVGRLAALLRRARGMNGNASEQPGPDPEWAAVAAVVFFVAGRIVDGEPFQVAELEAMLGR